MAEKKIIAVMGATGAQGGGLVRAILDDPSGGFAARAITRDVNSDKAKALRESGAEVVAADVDDPESLRQAFEGAYGAYCVTFYWDHFSPEKELPQAQQSGAGREGRGVAARGVVHAGRYAPVGAADRQSDADTDGQIQGAAFRCEGHAAASSCLELCEPSCSFVENQEIPLPGILSIG